MYSLVEALGATCRGCGVAHALRSLADECASYLVLGLDGPSATAEEIKKAYRNLEALRGSTCDNRFEHGHASWLRHAGVERTPRQGNMGNC